MNFSLKRLDLLHENPPLDLPKDSSLKLAHQAGQTVHALTQGNHYGEASDVIETYTHLDRDPYGITSYLPPKVQERLAKLSTKDQPSESPIQVIPDNQIIHEK